MDWRRITDIGPEAITVHGAHFFSHFYLLTFPPLFPLLIKEFSLSNVELGMIVSAGALFTAFLQTPFGELVDRFGAKRALVFALGVTGGGMVLAGLASSYIFLLVFALATGIGQAAFHPADYALLSVVTADEREGAQFALHNFAGKLGFATAPPAVGGLGLLYGWRTALLVIGGVGLCYALVVLVRLSPAHAQHLRDVREAEETATGSSQAGNEQPLGVGLNLGPVQRARQALRALNPLILWMFLFIFAMTMASNGINTFTVVFFTSSFAVGPTMGTTALTAYTAAGAISVLIGGILADRYSAVWLIAGSLLGVIVLVLAVAILPISALSGVGLFAAIGFFFGLVAPARDRLISLFSSAGSTGKSFGLAHSGISFAVLLSPIVLGATIDFANVNIAYVVIAVFFGISVVLLLGGSWYVNREVGVPVFARPTNRDSADT